tara:strand:+ start:12649 stop:13413 length:765 start_codon:yes stop_codon:yes gene_type:complete
MPRIKTSFVSLGSNSGQPSQIRTANPLRAKLTTQGLLDDDGNDANIEVVFPFGPKDISHDKIEARFREIARPGKQPLLVKENEQLRTVSFSAVLAHKESGGVLPVDDLLGQIETIAANGYKCKFIYANTALSYFVKITKLSYSIQYRDNEGLPIRAEVSFQLTEAPIFNPDIVLLKAIYRNPNITTDPPPAPEPPEDEITQYEWSSMQQPARFAQLLEKHGIGPGMTSTPSISKIDYLYEQSKSDIVPTVFRAS